MHIQSSWEKKIQSEYDDRKASVIWALTDGNDIEKGIASDLSYSDSDLKYVNKKGFEVKEKLVSEKMVVAAKLAEANIKLKALRKLIGFDSLGEEPEMSHSVDYKSKYSYKQMYPENSVDGLSGETISNQLSKDIVSKMREYNNCVYGYHHCQKELKTLNTVIENVKDKKDYKLPLRIATDLGF